MRTLTLGPHGPEVSAIGLGCMGFTMSWPPFLSEKESIAVIRDAFDCGVTLFDTAESYGPYTNEELVGKALEPIRNNVCIASKFGYNFDRLDSTGRPIGLCSKRAKIIRSVDGMLKRLRTDHIDILYQHRVDPDTPIEEVADTVSDLIRAGKVLYWGMSEAAPATVKRAHTVCPLTVVQSEYSMWYRKPEKELLPLLRELGIAFIPFSPLGKGVLTGKITAESRFADADYRSKIPRFNPENLAKNMDLVNYIASAASSKGITSAQFALAWLMAQHPWLVPIPGTKKHDRLIENIGAANVSFSENELKDIRSNIECIEIYGDRYPEDQERLTGI